LDVERPKPNVGPSPLLTPLVFTAAAVQPTGLPNFGDNFAAHPPPFDDLDAVVHPPIPFSNVWDLKFAQGAHLGLRGKATADRRVRKCGGIANYAHLCKEARFCWTSFERRRARRVPASHGAC
jgi:hypothetical protein